MAHAHCMLETYGYKCTHSLCNTHSFSTATMVARTTPPPHCYVMRTLPVLFYFWGTVIIHTRALKLACGGRFILLYSKSLVEHAGFEVLTALLLKVEVSWGVSQCAAKLFSMFRRIVPSYSGSSRQRRMTFLTLIPP